MLGRKELIFEVNAPVATCVLTSALLYSHEIYKFYIRTYIHCTISPARRTLHRDTLQQ